MSKFLICSLLLISNLGFSQVLSSKASVSPLKIIKPKNAISKVTQCRSNYYGEDTPIYKNPPCNEKYNIEECCNFSNTSGAGCTPGACTQ